MQEEVGKVGIGTTSPQRPLHVNGTEGVARFTSTASGNNGFEVGIGVSSQAFLWQELRDQADFGYNYVNHTLEIFTVRPKWDNPNAKIRPEQGLLGLRAALKVFANIRPVQIIPSLANASPLKNHLLEKSEEYHMLTE